VGKTGVKTDSDDLLQHNSDWTNKFVGQSQLLLQPKSTEEVSAILKHCNDRRLAVVP
jgi:FAD/FMN-containing dehydrogenase